MLKVMIIDDDMNVRKCLRQLIPWPETGCEIMAEASNGTEGLERFHAARPDVCITNVQQRIQFVFRESYDFRNVMKLIS